MEEVLNSSEKLLWDEQSPQYFYLQKAYKSIFQNFILEKKQISELHFLPDGNVSFVWLPLFSVLSFSEARNHLCYQQQQQ